MPPDFYLITSIDNEWTEAVSTFPEIVKLAWQDDATAVYRCCPSDNLMTNVTADMAREWWGDWNWKPSDGINAIPPLFLSELESDAQEAINAAEDPSGTMTRADNEYDLRRGA